MFRHFEFRIYVKVKPCPHTKHFKYTLLKLFSKKVNRLSFRKFKYPFINSKNPSAEKTQNRNFMKFSQQILWCNSLIFHSAFFAKSLVQKILIKTYVNWLKYAFSFTLFQYKTHYIFISHAPKIWFLYMLSTGIYPYKLC